MTQKILMLKDKAGFKAGDEVELTPTQMREAKIEMNVDCKPLGSYTDGRPDPEKPKKVNHRAVPGAQD